MDNGQAFREIQRSLGRVEGKLEAVHEEVHRQGAASLAVASRVDMLESKYDRIKGGWAALAALAGIVGAMLTFALNWMIE